MLSTNNARGLLQSFLPFFLLLLVAFVALWLARGDYTTQRYGYLNNDNFPDVVRINENMITVMLSYGTDEQYQEPQVIFTADTTIVKFSLPDINGDGYNDIIFYTIGGKTLRLQNDGEGAFALME